MDLQYRHIKHAQPHPEALHYYAQIKGVGMLEISRAC